MIERKRERAEGWPSRIRRLAEDPRKAAFQNCPDFETEEQLWKEAFQRYRGGNYWNWVPENPQDPNSDGAWVVAREAIYPGEEEPYGTRLWNYYTDVRNGNLPPGWN